MSVISDYSLVSSKICKTYMLPEVLQDVIIGCGFAESITDQAKFCISLPKCFSWRIKTRAKRERWNRCRISTGLLLATPFLFGSHAVSSGATQRSQFLKQHTAAPQHARAGKMDATWGNSKRHLCLPWRTGDCPYLGAWSHLLLDTETPGFPLQDGLQDPPGVVEGGPVQAGLPLQTHLRAGARGSSATTSLKYENATSPTASS